SSIGIPRREHSRYSSRSVRAKPTSSSPWNATHCPGLSFKRVGRAFRNASTARFPISVALGFQCGSSSASASTRSGTGTGVSPEVGGPRSASSPVTLFVSLMASPSIPHCPRPLHRHPRELPHAPQVGQQLRRAPEPLLRHLGQQFHHRPLEE